MDSALSPREIQARIRGGASVSEVAEEAGVDVERIRGFAGPVLAEREHMTRTALASTVRRRGDGTGHRKLADIITERLEARGIDADEVSWDSWRMPDRRWALLGRIEDEDEAASRSAEFLFDPKGRFNVAANADGRWMIGEQLPGVDSPDNENTVDFQDELALVRATQDTPDVPGDDVPRVESSYDSEATSELDDLYDMMSGISEDSVRIYVGLDDDGQPVQDAPAQEVAAEPSTPPRAVEEPAQDSTPEPEAQEAAAAAPVPTEATPEEEPQVTEPEQDALVEAPEGAPEPEKPKSRRRRAKIPSWDEIMFGGPTKDS
ncbi:septation protein SepH [Tessaracoccus terricola]